MTQSGGPRPPQWPEAPPSFGSPQPLGQSPAPSATAELPHPHGSGGSPSIKQALTQRVRFAGGELPLWGVLGPAFAASAVVIALGAAAATAREVMVETSPVSSASALASAAPAPAHTEEKKAPETQEAPSAAPEAPKKPLTLIERAASGDGSALSELEQRPAAELAIDEALAIATGRATREREEAEKLRGRLAQDPALIKNPKVLGELYRFTQNPESAREALAAIANVPGPISADLLYEVWTGTPTKTDTTELAQALLLGKGVRAKAAPPLAIALELRTTEDCEAIAAALPRVIELADKRSFVSLTKLQRKSGCGPNKRQDCYPCLRKGDPANNLKEALKVVRTRREPTPFKG